MGDFVGLSQGFVWEIFGVLNQEFIWVIFGVLIKSLPD
jgi:hypothetical protein